MKIQSFIRPGWWLDQFQARYLKFLDETLLKIYGSPHIWVRKWAKPLFYHQRRWALFLFKGRSLKIIEMRGLSAGSCQPLRVICFMGGKSLDYLRSILFEEGNADCFEHGQCSIFQLPAYAARFAPEADLILVDRMTVIRWKPPSGEWLTAPTWVRMVMDFKPGDTWEAWDRFLMQKQEMNIKRFRRAGFQARESQDPQDFDFFYDRMYVPLIQDRHKGYGVVDKKGDLWGYFNHGRIMFALDDQRPVAGDFSFRQGEVFFGVNNGILDGNREWMKKGVLSFLYYMAIQWCVENRIRRFDVGEIRPLVQDGVYKHKSQWGFEAVQDTTWGVREWLWWVPGDSTAALDWLAAHPFIPQFVEYQGSGLNEIYGKQNAGAALEG